MASVNIKVKMMGAEELAASLKKAQRAAPDILMRAIRLAGTHFKKDVVSRTKKAVKERTGNLCKGYRRQVKLSGREFGEYRAEVFGGAGRAKHYHLVENGHRKFNRAGTRPIGWTKGIKTMEKTANDWENDDKMLKYSQKAVREALRKGALDD